MINKFIVFIYILLFISGCDKDYYKGIRLDKIVTKAINNPESIFFDKDSNYLYVSNINGKSLEKDGNGYISVLSLSGEIIEFNSELESSPELVNEDPYDSGWMIKIKLTDTNLTSHLLDSKQYKDLVSNWNIFINI